MKQEFDDASIMTEFFSSKHEGSSKKQKNPYKLIFRVDDNLSKYLKEIAWTKRKTITDYLNDLIREDMKSFLGTDSDEQLAKKWEEYKKKAGL